MSDTNPARKQIERIELELLRQLPRSPLSDQIEKKDASGQRDPNIYQRNPTQTPSSPDIYTIKGGYPRKVLSAWSNLIDGLQGIRGLSREGMESYSVPALREMKAILEFLKDKEEIKVKDLVNAIIQYFKDRMSEEGWDENRLKLEISRTNKFIENFLILPESQGAQQSIRIELANSSDDVDSPEAFFDTLSIEISDPSGVLEEEILLQVNQTLTNKTLEQIPILKIIKAIKNYISFLDSKSADHSNFSFDELAAVLLPLLDQDPNKGFIDGEVDRSGFLKSLADLLNVAGSSEEARLINPVTFEIREEEGKEYLVLLVGENVTQSIAIEWNPNSKSYSILPSSDMEAPYSPFTVKQDEKTKQILAAGNDLYGILYGGDVEQLKILFRSLVEVETLESLEIDISWLFAESLMEGDKYVLDTLGFYKIFSKLEKIALLVSDEKADKIRQAFQAFFLEKNH